MDQGAIAVPRSPGLKTCFPSRCQHRVPNGSLAEQIFLHLRKHLSNRLFEDLEALQSVLVEELQVFWTDPTVLLSLTSYPWWIEGTGLS